MKTVDNSTADGTEEEGRKKREGRRGKGEEGQKKREGRRGTEEEGRKKRDGIRGTEEEGREKRNGRRGPAQRRRAEHEINKYRIKESVRRGDVKLKVNTKSNPSKGG
ncbi:hypothetical protein Pmani_014039 [Petrolisthes manimaculis]|uniref:Uncharacterized protein n=1 Tax=Petrolisthes manimaculis TaxID=1843537 RepID=A0AAE1PTK7_9EUCA|nr:hypothetical protein Pmani_014039 [Petrolisthes manimaculis]